MSVEAYLRQNQESITQECQAINSKTSKAIITLKKDGEDYICQVSTVEEFTAAIPNNNFFKTMRDSIRTAVVNKIIPIIVFENQEARIISLPDEFKYEK
ncbi:MAG: hypothetical protein AAFO95_08595 [Cyanobacteria bacterium J06600_6]